MNLARAVHTVDGYPPYLGSGLEAFIVSPDLLEAWVAEDNAAIVGHVALHSRSSPAALALAGEELHRPVDRLGVVARLFVARNTRRQGVGHALLDIASEGSVSRGLWPMLDVATRFSAAVELYEGCGWIRAGQITNHFPDGSELDEFVYVAPPRLHNVLNGSTRAR